MSTEHRQTVRKAQFIAAAIILALWGVNPGMDAFHAYLDHERMIHLEQRENLTLEAADWLGSFQTCRHSFVLASVFTATYRSAFLKEQPDALIFLGLAGQFIPLGTKPVEELGVLRGCTCATYDY